MANQDDMIVRIGADIEELKKALADTGKRIDALGDKSDKAGDKIERNFAEAKKEVDKLGAKADETGKKMEGAFILGALKSRAISAAIGTTIRFFTEMYEVAEKNKSTLDSFSAAKLEMASAAIKDMDAAMEKLQTTLAVKGAGVLAAFGAEMTYIAEYWSKVFGTDSVKSLGDAKSRLEEIKQEIKDINAEINKRTSNGLPRSSTLGLEGELVDLQNEKRQLEALLAGTKKVEKERAAAVTAKADEKRSEELNSLAEYYMTVSKIESDINAETAKKADEKKQKMDQQRADELNSWAEYYAELGKIEAEKNAQAEQQRIDELNSWAEYQLTLGEMEMEKNAQAEQQRVDELNSWAEYYIELGNLEAEKNAEELARRQEINDQLNGIDRRAQQANLMMWEAGWKGRMHIMGDVLGDMSVLMQTENRKMFEVGKAAAISSTVISTYEGAQKAYTSLAGIPIVGPALGGVAAGAAIVAGLARVQSISSTNMGGGGGVSAGSVGGGTGGGITQQAPQNVIDATFNVQGTMVSKDQIRGLAAGLNELAADGGKLRSVRVI